MAKQIWNFIICGKQLLEDDSDYQNIEDHDELNCHVECPSIF